MRLIGSNIILEEIGDSSTQESSSYGSEPEYGTEEYVDRWDQSQQSNDDWAYLLTNL